MRGHARRCGLHTPCVNLLFVARRILIGRIRNAPQVGFVLVQLKQGLWGVTSESQLVSTYQQSVASIEALQSTTTANVTQACRTPPVVNATDHIDRKGEDTPVQGGSTASSFFEAWAPLWSVTERYVHHALSRRRRTVICLADSGLLHTFHFGPENGEARKVGSWKIPLQANGATATCMCLLPKTPACVADFLGRLVTSQAASATNVGTAHREVDEDGRGKDSKDAFRGNGGFACFGGGRNGVGRLAYQDQCREKDDQVVAIGTSHGHVLLVETVVTGTVS